MADGAWIRQQLDEQYSLRVKGAIPDKLTLATGVTVAVVDVDECVCSICHQPFSRLTTQAFGPDGKPLGPPKPVRKTVCMRCRLAMDARDYAYEVNPTRARVQDAEGAFDFTARKEAKR